jgi:hypothetical protein
MLRHWLALALLNAAMTTIHEAPFGMRRNLPTKGGRTVSKVLKNMHFLKRKLTSSRFFLRKASSNLDELFKNEKKI